MEQNRNDLLVQCCRCKNKHKESERKKVPNKRIEGTQVMVCPRCHAHSFYEISPWVAWCWASGLIEFGDTVPEGAIHIASGPKCSIKVVVRALAREGQGASFGKLLVPGIPEAENQKQAGDALASWLEWCAKGNGKKYQDGVVFHSMKGE